MTAAALLFPLPLRQREGPAAGGRVRGLADGHQPSATYPSPSHCSAMGSFLSRKGRGVTNAITHYACVGLG
jgi:hypothetical protein